MWIWLVSAALAVDLVEDAEPSFYVDTADSRIDVRRWRIPDATESGLCTGFLVATGSGMTFTPAARCASTTSHASVWINGPPAVVCEVALSVRRDGKVAIEDIRDCPTAWHAAARSEAQPHLDDWCAWGPQGWPEAYDVTVKVDLYPQRVQRLTVPPGLSLQ